MELASDWRCCCSPLHSTYERLQTRYHFRGLIPWPRVSTAAITPTAAAAATPPRRFPWCVAKTEASRCAHGRKLRRDRGEAHQALVSHPGEEGSQVGSPARLRCVGRRDPALHVFSGCCISVTPLLHSCFNLHIYIYIRRQRNIHRPALEKNYSGSLDCCRRHLRPPSASILKKNPRSGFQALFIFKGVLFSV